jgi:3-methylcrotonyl-CoA carboxylase alpha subunit
MFTSVLIANRGEIACRIAATCARLGIRSIAVYSEADAGAAHVAACDDAVPIGPAAAAHSYLDARRIVQAALDSGAQAVHPGYGFLSENPDFARACAAAGLVFIGPPPEAIESMGLKAESKRLMQAAGVPVVPGYHGAQQEDELLAEQAARIGWPVLIKASAGGGGKGMREVHAQADFAQALAGCRREARAAFGDDAVLIEKLVARPRHIEIQVFADRHGQAVALFERDCSLQRRHQKVVEEAPAPGLTPEQRRLLADAAVAAARAVGYQGAGTVEFIAEGDGAGGIRDFYFMEMNTRLQVEHPVTEMITGLDLVEWQLRVAAGEPLPAAPQRPHGHAVEVRLYAESPRNGFLPSSGRVQRLQLPAGAARFQVAPDPAGLPAALRVDSGVREGDSVSTFYDPMVAKLIAWGETRGQAIGRLAEALRGTRLAGPDANTAFLRRLLGCHDFVAGIMDTGLIGRELERLLASDIDPTHAALAVSCALLQQQLAQAADDPDPWARRDAWSNGVLPPRTLRLARGAQQVRARVGRDAAGWNFACDEQPARALRWQASRSGADEWELRVQCGELTLHAHVVGAAAALHPGADDDARLHVFIDGEHAPWVWQRQAARAAGAAGTQDSVRAPMPGRIVALPVAAGQAVRAGQTLVVLEAMKMEHTLQAGDDGVVDAVLVTQGAQVDDGALLLRMRGAQAEPEA